MKSATYRTTPMPKVAAGIFHRTPNQRGAIAPDADSIIMKKRGYQKRGGNRKEKQTEKSANLDYRSILMAPIFLLDSEPFC